MGMIVACPIDENTSLEMPKSVKGFTFSVGGDSREFIPLYCPYCHCLSVWIDKESVEQDGSIWRYKS